MLICWKRLIRSWIFYSISVKIFAILRFALMILHIGGGTAGDIREFPRLVQGSQGKVSFFPGPNFRPK
jgi:hypothetical protein